MMQKNEMENNELISLNSEISEFDVQELENRLETDPLMVGGLVDLTSTQDLSRSIDILSSDECGSCSWFSHNN